MTIIGARPRYLKHLFFYGNCWFWNKLLELNILVIFYRNRDLNFDNWLTLPGATFKVSTFFIYSVAWLKWPPVFGNILPFNFCMRLKIVLELLLPYLLLCESGRFLFFKSLVTRAKWINFISICHFLF